MKLTLAIVAYLLVGLIVGRWWARQFNTAGEAAFSGTTAMCCWPFLVLVLGSIVAAHAVFPPKGPKS